MEIAGRYPVMLMIRALEYGGTERQLTEMALGLDHDVFAPHVACFRATGLRLQELEEGGIPLVHLSAGSLMGLSTIRGGMRLGAYLTKHRIQLVHTFDTPMNLFGVPAARAYRVPVVLSSQRAFRHLTPLFGRHLLRLSDRMVDGVVVNCEAVRRDLIEEDQAPRSLIHLCYNGIDTRVFRPCGSQRPAESGPTIGVVCALRREKDLGTLLRAFAGVRKMQPGVRLLIVGSGPCSGELENLSGELGLGESCRFEPAVRDVAPWMRQIDIFVLPSLSEALSNSLMEAMACGCCPVASDVGGNPELVTPGQTGLLFRAGDAADLQAKLELLVSDTALRQAMGANAAVAIARDFSLTASAARMGEIYLQFLRALGNPQQA